ncbi:MAG: hypothetical protein JWO41_400 [Candidatus Saccharibacteria bacterium]|nr:hypothetical protein [Candidatus Saccharibacteria bacterium]
MTGYRVRTALMAVGLAALVSLANVSGVSAATASKAPGAGNGLRVSPVRSDITINPGKSQVINITVNNITSQDAYFQVVANDFTASADETGNPAIVFDTSKPVTAHSLKQFAQPVQPFLLHSGEQKSIAVTFKVPANAVAGGYYGVIRFAPANPDGSTNKNLSLAGSVGSLVLLKVPGNIKEQLSIASFDIRDSQNRTSSFFTTNKNLNIVARFQNLGDIQDQPFGKVIIKNHSGQTLGSYEINNSDTPANVLPDSIRRFTIPIKGIGSFGQYKVEGNFGYGNGGQLLSASTTFYVIPVLLIVLFVGIVAVLVFLIFGLPRVIAAYNRRVVDQSRHGRRY